MKLLPLSGYSHRKTTQELEQTVAELEQVSIERDQALAEQKRLQCLLEKHGIHINESTA